MENLAHDSEALDARRRDRVMGALIGLAVGDCMGTALEFRTPPDSGSFEGTPDEVRDLGGGACYGETVLAIGQWTDDTSMALCLAESLLERGRFDPVDQLRRYLRWWQTGHLSSTGSCFDIGIGTRQALSEFEATGEPFRSADSQIKGNGCLMRLAPVPMAWHREPDLAIRIAGESSRTTHGSRTCVDACRYFGGLLVGAITGASKNDLLNERYHPAGEKWAGGELETEVEAVASGSYLSKQPPLISGSGYVIRSLEAALWAFAHTGSFASGLLKVVNLGNDADTTGAIYGQIAGAHYGLSAIPEEWIAALAQRERLLDWAARLADLRPESASSSRA